MYRLQLKSSARESATTPFFLISSSTKSERQSYSTRSFLFWEVTGTLHRSPAAGMLCTARSENERVLLFMIAAADRRASGEKMKIMPM
ncbi:hypothetical protein DM860_017738 [Cuscuta australis]|uniref:Uncharacterized protein n=1 Tax=Cuscuta australis TaxID=267555 RepID=A0A328DA46_9ASTE|nr:hypothetical protein DM860_017738 [Cuscuta australis]